MESPAPDQHDPHSSEEELEVINNSKQARSRRPPRAASVSLPEKRKWSQVKKDLLPALVFLYVHVIFSAGE